MYKNYENRVKDFVLDMTNPNLKIEYKDVTEKVTNTRVELMNELFANYPEKKKPLVFRGYTTEADRIKDTIKKYKYLYYLPDYEKIKKEKKKLKTTSSPKKLINKNKSSSFEKRDRIEKKKIKENHKFFTPNKNLTIQNELNKSESNKNKYIIFQPTMRYKARTDLERVYDAINEYNLNEKSKDIIERQLKSINLYDYKKSGDLLYGLENKNEDNNLYKKYNSRNILAKINRHGKKKKNFDLYKTNKLYFNPKNEEYKPWQRREDLNNEAYGLLSSYHYKTHFKAAEEIAESNYQQNKKNKSKNSVFLLPNLLPKNYQRKPIIADEDRKVKEDPFKFGEDEDLSEESEDYEEFDKNYNPFSQKNKTTIDPVVMKLLTKMAFKKKKSEYDNFDFKNDEDQEKSILHGKKNKKTIKNYTTEDNNVIIRNKLYYKNSQFDKITSEILGLCNVYSPKSKFNNTVHKSKGGKTMITQGMTVKEFEKKYRLQE